MPEHQYNAEQALEVLMRKLKERDEALAAQIQAAIDAGKDISETEPSTDRRKKARIYRKTVPFTHEEALQVALDALRANFVEQPLFVESAAQNFTKAAIGTPQYRTSQPRQNVSEKRDAVSAEHVDEEKAVEVELQTETQIEKSGPETEPLKRPDPTQIEKQQHQLNALRSLVNFEQD